LKTFRSGAWLGLLPLLACGSIQAVSKDGGNGDASPSDASPSDTSRRDASRSDTSPSDTPQRDGPGSEAAIPDASHNGPPMVMSTDPPSGATEVVLNQKISATFNEPMNPSTLTAATFTVKQGTTAVAGVVSAVGATATFAPSSALAAGATFTATITTGAQDPAGSSLAKNYPWTFTTSACAQTPVDLGTASTFAVLAGSTVANTGPTSVVGDVGVSPGTALTGFPPGTIVGFQHAGDPTAAQGEADVSTAYDDATARKLCPNPISGDLGGMTLLPGLYTSISSLELTSGDLTLNAHGDANAVFIFQMATTLTTAAGTQVKLSGSASAGNVFWQVGSSATLGVMSTLQGTILAAPSITLNLDATVDGRVLARTAAVVMNSSMIVAPASQ
jgi:hypothetical protein